MTASGGVWSPRSKGPPVRRRQRLGLGVGTRTPPSGYARQAGMGSFEGLRSILDRIEGSRLYVLLGRLYGIVGLAIGLYIIYSGVFRRPEVSLRYEVVVLPPLTALVGPARVGEGSADALIQIEVDNLTDHEESIDLRVPGADSVIALGLESNIGAIAAHRGEVSAPVVADGVVGFPQLRALPPLTRIRMTLWARRSLAFLGDPVTMTSSAKMLAVRDTEAHSRAADLFDRYWAPAAAALAAVLVARGQRANS